MNNNLKLRIVFFALVFFSVSIFYQNCSQPGSVGLSSVNMSSTGLDPINNIRDPITLIAPQSIQINGGSKYTQDQNVLLAISARGAEEMQISNDEDCSNGKEWISYVESKTWTIKDMNSLNHVSIKFRKKGLPETSCINAAIFHDNTLPVVSLLNAIPKASNSEQMEILFKAEDNSNDSLSVICKLPNEKEQLCSDRFIFSKFLVDGNYSLSIYAKDLAGNSSLPLNVSFIIDRTPPELKINGPAAVIAQKNLNFEITALDTNPIKSVLCRLQPIEIDFKDCSNLKINYQELNAGKYNFEVKAIDIADNLTVKSQPVEIDLTVPTVRITKNPSSYSNQTSVAFEFTGFNGSNPIQKFNCKIDETEIPSCKSPFNVSDLKEGAHVFSVVGFNDLNVKSEPQTYQFVSDTTPPIIKVVSGPGMNEIQKNNSPNFVLDAFDTNGIKSIVCYLNNQASECSSKAIQYKTLADGVYSFKAVATDSAGNTAQTNVISWKIDTTPDSQILASFEQSPIKENAGATLNVSLQSVTKPSYTCKSTFDGQLLSKGDILSSVSKVNFTMTSDATCTVYAYNKENILISTSIDAEISCGNKLKTNGKCADFKCNSIKEISFFSSNILQIPARDSSGVCYAFKIFDLIGSSNSSLTKMIDTELVSRTHGSSSPSPTRNPYLMNKAFISFNLEGARVVKLSGGLSASAPILADNYLLVGVFPQKATPLTSHYSAYGTSDSTIPGTNYVLFRNEPVNLTPFATAGTASIAPVEIVREADANLNYNLDVRALDCGGVRQLSDMYILFQ